ncbi:MAG: radical SAM peptide maturase, CXXX-repeat target family [Lachnospiraceae bacterium]|nr:radical SAM peptide maturase, CXXX-repeat target family [Lachnospiraceae bacterium]
MSSEYIMGKSPQYWKTSNAQEITFVVTQECNLSCKYCYMIKKGEGKVMSFEVAKDAIDFFIENKDDLDLKDYLTLDFIGGEPLLEVDLIEKIVDYFRIETYRRNSNWFGKYRILISTNGLLYDSPEVQRFLWKNKNMISIGISIDGTKEKHNMQRIFPDGTGSYDEVARQTMLWLKQYPDETTKVTIGHDDLPLVKDSIIHLWNLGLKVVPANVVFEDIWQEGDDVIFENQLKQLADYVLENQLWNKVNTTLFSEQVGYKALHDEMLHNSCGTGRSFTVDYEGKLYPCIRFMKYSLDNKNEISFGDIYKGVDTDKIRPFLSLNTKYQSKQECIDCSVSSSCSFCPGYNYDISKNDTLFERATTICEMHKARVKANRYYWARLYNLHGIKCKPEIKKKPYKYLYILTSDFSVSYCDYYSFDNDRVLNKSFLDRGLEFAKDNFYSPVLVHHLKECNSELYNINKPYTYDALNSHLVTHIKYYQTGDLLSEDIIYVVDCENINLLIDGKTRLAKIIFNIDGNQIFNLSNMVIGLLEKVNRVHMNIRIEDKTKFDVTEYERQMNKIADEIVRYINKHEVKEVNRLTDRIFSGEMNNCNAGERSLTLAPDGQLYICPAFYYNKMNPIGTYNESSGEYEFLPEISLTELANSPNCNNCDCYQCNRCIFQNKNHTGEYNVPSALQCKISHIEREISRKLLPTYAILEIGSNCHIDEISYKDPINVLLDRKNAI